MNLGSWIESSQMHIVDIKMNLPRVVEEIKLHYTLSVPQPPSLMFLGAEKYINFWLKYEITLKYKHMYNWNFWNYSHSN
jgi:hypothetical protein